MNWGKWYFGWDDWVCMLGVPLVSPPNSWPIAVDTCLKPQQLGADAHQWGMKELCGHQTDLLLWKQWISPCFREVGGELSPWAWFWLSDWIGCCTAVVEQQPMKGLSVSQWSQLGREARGSNLFPLRDSQGHSPPWHLKTKSLTLVAHSPKGGLHYSAGSCTQTPQLGWLREWAVLVPHHTF